ncbi:GIY-YIG nuclease family protein [Puerhibacterium puerhi]|uniref:GIY-YIG nuclease family protein n=1 Tax=Puerhibacterium puerhi TaxID=2692623 RepID=UPI0019167086|nr:hypothetical protein [Puerhibacterium puerhi]
MSALHAKEALLAPNRATSQVEALGSPSSVPAEPGVYAWYFDISPLEALPEGVYENELGHLLYVGIAPRKPRSRDGRPSRENLRKRIREHFSGDASRSTLRLTLGSLLSDELKLQLRRVGASERRTFGEGEAVLSDWIAEHARACWYVDRRPWDIESALIADLVLPLNLAQNEHSPLRAAVSAARHSQRQTADMLPVLPAGVLRAPGLGDGRDMVADVTSVDSSLPGTYRVADASPVKFSEAMAVWIPLAYQELVATARKYHAVITYRELSDQVQERSGIRTRVLLTNWIGKLLEEVAVLAKTNGEPPLTSLCVHQDGTIGPGYAKAPRSVVDEPGDDIEHYAAEHRLLCYRKYAEDLPDDGGRPALTKAEAERRARKTAKEPARRPECPTCFTTLPATGVCDYC